MSANKFTLQQNLRIRPLPSQECCGVVALDINAGKLIRFQFTDRLEMVLLRFRVHQRSDMLETSTQDSTKLPLKPLVSTIR